ncbi:hypothetical protein [Desulfatibacillum aliphaticivorans]|uniref:hypothetical protein n=1 Tax=Desulfatibacillum aliphaticivorans TaxID=218208 RepID=UPI0003F4ED36|nr:hypothetical protein [Desulfatibacillum aliphaticivorans]
MKNQVEVFEPEELTEFEQDRRDALEGIIKRNMAGFIAVGLALKEMLESRLYRSTHPTWEAYIRDFFEISRSYALRLIDAADTVRLISNEGIDPVDFDDGRQNVANWQHPVPANEAQVRPLSKLPVEDRPGAWFEALKTAPEGKITARHVSDTVKKIKGETVQQTVKKIREGLNKDELYSPEFKGAFDAFLIEIEKAKEGGFKETSKEAITRHLDALKTVVAAN